MWRNRLETELAPSILRGVSPKGRPIEVLAAPHPTSSDPSAIGRFGLWRLYQTLFEAARNNTLHRWTTLECRMLSKAFVGQDWRSRCILHSIHYLTSINGIWCVWAPIHVALSVIAQHPMKRRLASNLEVFYDYLVIQGEGSSTLDSNASLQRL